MYTCMMIRVYGAAICIRHSYKWCKVESINDQAYADAIVCSSQRTKDIGSTTLLLGAPRKRLMGASRSY